MKPIIILALLFTTAPAIAQVNTLQEKIDTFFGISIVLDTIRINKQPDQLTMSLWPSYTVSRYQVLVDGMGIDRPRINDIRYYRLDDCTEIPYRRLFAFKQQ